MAKIVSTKSGFQIRHETNNLLLRSVSGRGDKSRAKAEKMRREIMKRNCGVKGQRCK